MVPMRGLLLVAALGGMTLAAFACGTGGTETVGEASFELQDGGGVILGPAGSGLATGLPCDVQAVLENRCITCHAATSTDPAPLVDYATLSAPSNTDPSKSMAAVALERMKSATAPMPPPPAVAPDADEILTFEEWIAAGTPRGGLCTDPPPDGGAFDAGDLGDAGGDAAPPCTSGQRWLDGNAGSPSMHPGLACQGCHQQQGGPGFRFAGTVYRNGLHDIDDCNGASPPPALSVVVTDKDGKQISIPVNGAGNFAIESISGGGGGGGGKGKGGGRGNSFKAPYRVTISDGTLTRAMNGSITSGDCNSCHTASGANGAPGRILAP